VFLLQLALGSVGSLENRLRSIIALIRARQWWARRQRRWGASRCLVLSAGITGTQRRRRIPG